jgi:hypothetical protein
MYFMRFRLSPTRNRIGLIVLLAILIVAHVGLWSSDRMPAEVKLRLTVINALGWAIVLLPAFAVGKWLDAHRNRPDRRKP